MCRGEGRDQVSIFVLFQIFDMDFFLETSAMEIAGILNVAVWRFPCDDRRQTDLHSSS